MKETFKGTLKGTLKATPEGNLKGALKGTLPNLLSQSENFKLCGFIYLVFLKKFELFSGLAIGEESQNPVIGTLKGALKGTLKGALKETLKGALKGTPPKTQEMEMFNWSARLFGDVESEVRGLRIYGLSLGSGV